MQDFSMMSDMITFVLEILFSWHYGRFGKQEKSNLLIKAKDWWKLKIQHSKYNVMRKKCIFQGYLKSEIKCVD